MKNQITIGIDPGSEQSGVCVLRNSDILSAFVCQNADLLPKITPFLIYPSTRVALEVIRPYSLRLTMQVISTAMWIGELKFRLVNGSGCHVEEIARNDVKKWVFDTFPEVCMPAIEKKIAKKGYTVAATGAARKPSFVFVDDKLVTEAMKVLYRIEKPKPGAGYAHGLKDHSWQALATASFLNSKQVRSDFAEGE